MARKKIEIDPNMSAEEVVGFLRGFLAAMKFVRLTTEEAAAEIGRSEQVIRRLVTRGDLRVGSIGRLNLVYVDDLFFEAMNPKPGRKSYKF